MKTTKCIIIFLGLFLSAQMASAWYSPPTQRWINRDPVEEAGGYNLYGFANNDPVDRLDLWGLTGEDIPTPSDPYRDENRCRRRNGDCDPEEHAVLQAAVDAACKSGPSKCTGNQDTATLQANMAANLACAAARDTINNQCFKGGNAGHRQAADNARRAAAKCAAFLAKKTPQPPNPQPPKP